MYGSRPDLFPQMQRIRRGSYQKCGADILHKHNLFLCIEALPLVRYRTGDLTRLFYEPCECGRTTVRMENLSKPSPHTLCISSRIGSVIPSPPNRPICTCRSFSGFNNVARIACMGGATPEDVAQIAFGYGTFTGARRYPAYT